MAAGDRQDAWLNLIAIPLAILLATVLDRALGLSLAVGSAVAGLLGVTIFFGLRRVFSSRGRWL